MALLLDEAIGNITAALAETGLDKNTIVIAHSDNGGPVEGGFFNNNFPLRGGKASLWQVRARGRAGEGAAAEAEDRAAAADSIISRAATAAPVLRRLVDILRGGLGRVRAAHLRKR